MHEEVGTKSSNLHAAEEACHRPSWATAGEATALGRMRKATSPSLAPTAAAVTSMEEQLDDEDEEGCESILSISSSSITGAINPPPRWPRDAATDDDDAGSRAFSLSWGLAPSQIRGSGTAHRHRIF